MDIIPTAEKAEKASKKGKKGLQGIQADLMAEAAANLAGFRQKQGRDKPDTKYSIRGVISNGNKCQLSFALFGGNERLGIYRALPGTKPVKAKSWRPISDESKLQFFKL